MASTLAGNSRRVSWVLTATDRTGAAFNSMERNLRSTKMASDDANSSLSSMDEAGSRAANGLDTASGAITRNSNESRKGRASNDEYRGSLIEMAQASGFLSIIMRQLRFPVFAAGVNLAVQAVGALTAAVLALVGALGPALGLLAALPAAAASFVQGFSVARLATNGLLAGLKSLESDSLNAGRAATTASNQTQAALRRQEAAFERVRTAQRNVAQAQRQAAEQQTASARAIMRAEEALSRAHDRSRDAQDRLTRARKRAVEQIAELRRELARLQLNEEEAVFALEDAAEELAIAKIWEPYAPTDETLRRADLAHRKAIQDLDEIRNERARTADAVNEADSKGIDSTEQVRDALREVMEAQQNIAEQAEDLARTQAEAAQDQIDALDNVAEANYQLALAVKASSEAMDEFGETAASAGSKAATAFDKLNPAAKRFALFLFSLNPMLDRLRDSAGNALFPQLETAIRNLLGMFPMLESIVGSTAGALGLFAVRASEMISSGPFARDFADIANHNVTIMDKVGQVILLLVSGLRHLMIAAQPLVDWLLASAIAFANWIDKSLEAGRATGRLQAFFEQTRAVTQTLINIIKNLGIALYNVLRGGADLGRDMLGSFEQITAKWAEWTSSVEGNTAIRTFFDEMRPALHEIALLFGDVARGIASMASGPELAQTIAQIREQLLPALLRLMETSGQAFTTEFIETLTHLVNLFTQLSGSQGALTVFLSVLGDVFKVLAWAIENVPGMRQLITLFIIFRGVIAAWTVINFLTGMGGMLALLTKFPVVIGLVRAAFTLLAAHPIILFIMALALAAFLVIKNWDTLKGWFSAFAGWITNIIGGILSWVKENWPTLLAVLAGPIGIAVLLIVRNWETIKEVFFGAISWVVNLVQTIWGGLVGIISGIFSGIASVVRTVWGGITGFIGGVLNTISNTIGNIVGGISTTWSNLWNGIANVFNNIWNGIQNGFGAALNFLRGLWNAFVRGWNAVQITMPRINIPLVGEVGGWTIGLPDLPQLARGGRIMTGGFAWVGEQGPEIVRLPTGSTVLPNSMTAAVVSKEKFDPSTLMGRDDDERGAPPAAGAMTNDNRQFHQHFHNTKVDAKDAADRLHWMLKAKGV